jgi:hypothetical protein
VRRESAGGGAAAGHKTVSEPVAYRVRKAPRLSIAYRSVLRLETPPP